jgi:Tol biopolymer transport system component
MLVLFLVACSGTRPSPTAVPTATPSATPEESATSTPRPAPAATDTPPPPTVPVSPPDPAAGLVYSSADGLWLVDATGDPVLLIDESSARLSPDGTRVTYYFYDGTEGEYDVWLADLATGERRNLTGTPDRFEEEPVWWPGRPDVVVFGSDVGAGMESASYPTVVGVDGSGYQILDPEEGGPFALSPDGQMIAYGGYDDLGKIYRWGSGPEVFDPGSYGLAVEKLYQPAWSPDSRYLAWKVGGDLTGEGLWQLGVAVFDLEAGTAWLLHVYEPAGGGMFPHYLSWSPDGEWLAFVTFGEPPAGGRVPNLWVARPDGQDETYVGAGTEPTWSPDGRWLAFGQMRENVLGIALAEVGSWEALELDIPTNVRFIRGWISP